MHQKLGLVPSASTGEKRLVSESYAGGKVVEPDDLVLNRLKAHLGVFAHASQSGVISPDYTVLRPLPNAIVRYYEYLLKSPACRGELRIRIKGIVEGFWRLYTDDFYDIRLPVPPLDEQRQIVRFLDWHGAMTGKLIRAKRRLIALLNEQKQSIIHRAVTRGLDPAANLKTSGVEWLGDVPEGWAVTALKRACHATSLYGANLPADRYVESGIRFLRTTDIREDGTLKPDGVFVTRSDAEGCLLQPGDFLVSRSGTVGRAFVYDINKCGPASYAGYLVRFVLNKRLLLPDFLWLVTKSSYFRAFIGSSAIVSTIENVNGDKYSNFIMAYPNVDTQQEIVGFVRQVSFPINRAIDRALDEIALIQDFRVRLIADVVTGQLDVRAMAANLPDVAEAEAVGDLTEDDDVDDDGETLSDEEEAA